MANVTTYQYCITWDGGEPGGPKSVPFTYLRAARSVADELAQDGYQGLKIWVRPVVSHEWVVVEEPLGQRGCDATLR